ncbi:NAD(P)H-binding protein [Dactylosporangium sp. NPDC049525]|uniref:NmrA family NAD(P)-binding protein n=1 Tax=Dactylosporangium sp. NPDC049525 TaxID=3154730 RepID=UPI0034173473
MIVVTAPTGTIGRQVLAALLRSRQPVRVIARDPSRLAAHVRERVEVVPGSHGDPGVVDRAFAGADAVFWLAPVDPRAASLDAAFAGFTRPACAALTRHCVARVVGISALGRGFGRPAGLATASLAMDDLIAGTGVHYRALVMPAFMENMFMHAASITGHGVFGSPVAADLRLPTVATRDVAAVATRLLMDRDWSGQGSVALLGPQLLSFDDIARIVSQVLATPVRYQQVTAAAYHAAMIGAGMTEAMAQGLVDMLLAKNEGLDGLQARTPGFTTPTTFRSWCEQVYRPALLAAVTPGAQVQR